MKRWKREKTDYIGDNTQIITRIIIIIHRHLRLYARLDKIML